MTRELIIIGAGGMGREALGIVDSINAATARHLQFRGFLAEDPPSVVILDRLGVSVIGSPTDPRDLQRLRGTSFVVAVGDGPQRQALQVSLTRAGLIPTTLVHPSAIIGRDVEIGAGSIVCANSIVTTNVRIGLGAILNNGCTVAHDSRLGDFVTLAPGVNLSGAVSLGDRVSFGTNSAAIPSAIVGEGSTIGAGAVVIDAIPADVTAVGVPAKVLTSPSSA